VDVQDRDSVDASLGISRRTLLRRGALVGGTLVWTAPVVQTIAAPSAAAGTPLDGISYVAVVLSCDGDHYRMKWDVESGGVLVMASGTTFATPGADDMLGYPNLQSGPAPGASAGLVGEVLRVSASANCVLVDYAIKHGGGSVGPGTPGQPVTGSTGPWDFNPLPSPL
jgi:hypothetical protein